MRKLTLCSVVYLSLGGTVFAQPAKVDFGRDVLPIFRQNCVGCHGPSLANNGLRMDRKSSVFKDGFRRVVPGSSRNSFLYHRLVGTEYGIQMPPTGPLKPAQIATIKAWIEQGAEWPDALSNEAERPPFDPRAIAAVERLRSGDTRGFLKAMNLDSRLIDARGPEGSTPLMYAALYGDAAMLEALLKKGGNPNLKNDAGATALMWAATDLAKTRVLVAHGADVNAVSDDLRTPLMVAAGIRGGKPVVTLLLDHGAKVNPTRRPDAESSPLVQATLANDADTMQLLMARGTNIKASAGMALAIAYEQNCRACVDLLLKQDLPKEAYTMVLQIVANFGDAATVKLMLDRGAKVDEPDPLGHTALAYAAGSDRIPADVVKVLIEHGADVNSKSPHQNSVDSGMTVLDIARLRGETPVVDILLKAGAKSAVVLPAPPQPAAARSAAEAIRRSIPMLQRGDAGFTAKSGCVSCHNNSLVAMTVGLARQRGFKVDEAVARQQAKVNGANLEHSRDLLHQGVAGGGPFVDVFNAHILGYMLVGFHAEGRAADLDTDAAAMYIKNRQMPDGSWPYPEADRRPPLCSDYIGQTTLAMRGLQLYAPKAFQAEYEKSVSMAAAWLARTQAKSTEDHLWKLLGLAWANRDQEAIARERRELLALQRADGSWGDLPTMGSSAYATGKALVALQMAGLSVSDAGYQRGTAYLLKHQLADGTWYVPTRALGFQPYFETGYPHGVNQSISSAGSSWATMALLFSAEPPAAPKTSAADGAQ